MSDAHVPPHDLDAEMSVLSATFLSERALETVQELDLKPSDFYRSSHGTIYEIACELAGRSEPVDAITVSNELEKKGALERVGGKAKIHEIAAWASAAGNAGHYAKIVQETAGCRRLMTAGDAIRQLGRERPGALDELMGKAEEMLAGAVAPTITSQFAPITEGFAELVAEIEEAIASGKPKMGLGTGFIDIDRTLSGLHPGQLILVAARPAMGKSALGLNIAENVADNGTSAGVLTLEMSKAELQLRSLSRASKLDSQRLRQGRISQDELGQFRAGVAAVKMRSTNLFIEDHPNTTIQKLRAEARRMQRRHGLGLLVVDYLQLMVSSISEESRQQEISNISRGLKLLARELNIPIIALSQLNRNLEMRQDKRPFLSDLRDSGSLEQDADVVLFVYRDDYYNPLSEDKDVAEIIVSKNRQGSTGTVKLGWKKEITEFRNLASGLPPLRSAA